MPRFLFLIPCVKAITDKKDNSITVVSVLHGISPVAELDEVFAPDAVVPFSWSVVAGWREEAGDEGQAFEQRLQLIQPDGNQGFDSLHRFSFDALTVQTTADVPFFPVGQAGLHLLRLSVRRMAAEEEDAWKNVFEYPLNVDHVPLEERGRRIK